MKITLTTALIQSPLHWENPQANRLLFEEKIQNLSRDVDMILLPEMFSTGFSMTPEHIDVSEGKKTVAWMQHLAQQRGAALAGSIAFREGEKNYNRLFFVSPEGTIQHYDKKHRFSLAGEDDVYQAGTHKVSIRYRGFTICPLICYDLRFPVWSRNVEGYDVLLYVANWPDSRIAAWDILLKARAIENMAYCIGVNRIGTDGLGIQYTGHSAVYDALGKSLVYSEKEEILYAVLEKEHIDASRQHFKFLEDQDKFTLIG